MSICTDCDCGGGDGDDTTIWCKQSEISLSLIIVFLVLLLLVGDNNFQVYFRCYASSSPEESENNLSGDYKKKW